jgi:hypothetical protein
MGKEKPDCSRRTATRGPRSSLNYHKKTGNACSGERVPQSIQNTRMTKCREGEAGMVKRRENGEIGIFSLCLPVDISSVTGRCRRCWSHAKAKTQSQDKMFTFPAFHLAAFAPLREVNSSNRQTLESGQSGMLSDCLPVSLTPFRHPSLALPGLCPSVHRISMNFNALGRQPNGNTPSQLAGNAI